MVTSFDYIRRKLLVDPGDGQPFGVSLSLILWHLLYVHFIYIYIYKKDWTLPFPVWLGQWPSLVVYYWQRVSLSVEKGIGLFIINAHCWVVHFFFFFPVFSRSLLRMKAKSQEIQSTLDPAPEEKKSQQPWTTILIGVLGIKVNRLSHTRWPR